MHSHELPCSYVGFFQNFRLQVTTAAGYRMTGTAKVLIAVTLFLLVVIVVVVVVVIIIIVMISKL